MSVDILGTVNRRKNGAAPGHDPGERGECHAKSRGQMPKRKPKKRTPTFRLEFFIWRTDTQRASGITAANQPRMSIIAHVFGNVKPRRRKAPPGGQARRSRRREGLRSGLQWEGCGRRLEGTPGGPAKRGAKPGWNSLALPRIPSGAAGTGGARGEPHSDRQRPDCPLKGWERQQAGERTRAESPGGESPKKGGWNSRLCPRGWSRPGPKPRRGRARGDPRAARRATHTGGESKGNRSASEGRPQTNGNRVPA